MSQFLMDKEHVLVILRQNAAELRAEGLVHLRLFGSVARGDASAQSDVDLIADFDRSKPLTLVTMGRIEGRLSEMLSAKVDLSAADWMREPIREQTLSEAVVAF